VHPGAGFTDFLIFLCVHDQFFVAFVQEAADPSGRTKITSPPYKKKHSTQSITREMYIKNGTLMHGIATPGSWMPLKGWNWAQTKNPRNVFFFRSFFFCCFPS
jgi:hypothetical protein